MPVDSIPILKRFVEDLAPLRERLRKIILFGSRARGNHRPGSDFDVLILVDQRDQKLVDRIYDTAVVIQADEGCDLSLKIMTQAECDRRIAKGSRFIANVLREGVVLG